MTGGDYPDAEVWAREAAPFILDSIGPEQNGQSLHVPGFYTEEYMGSWIIRPGQALPPLAHDFSADRGLSQL